MMYKASYLRNTEKIHGHILEFVPLKLSCGTHKVMVVFTPEANSGPLEVLRAYRFTLEE